jgi:hypothetical protein
MPDQNAPETPPGPQVVKARDYKAKRTKLLNVGRDEWFRVKRGIDFQTMFMRGLVPTPIFNAALRFEEFRKTWNGSPQEAVESLKGDDLDAFMDLLRSCGALAIVEPRVTLSKAEAAADPDVLWLGGYSDIPGEVDLATNPNPKREDGDIADGALMEVYKYVLGESGIRVTEDAAANTFRPAEPAAVSADRPDGGTVQSPAVDAGPVFIRPEAGEAQERTLRAERAARDGSPEFQTPKVVEFIGGA